MRMTMDELVAGVARLIQGGAVEIGLEYVHGFTVLSWRFPNQPGNCLPIEMEEECSA